MDQSDDCVHHRSSPAAKIALFRSLFRGREDVYPRRFESRKTGKAGYQPVCANEWARLVREAQGQTRRLPAAPLSSRHQRSGSLAPRGPR
jgi:hypothetical protein